MKATITTLLTLLLAINILPSVYETRGYFAIGGEWFVLMLGAIMIYQLLSAIQSHRAN